MEQVIFQQCWKGLNFTKKSTFLETEKYQKKKKIKYIFITKSAIKVLKKVHLQWKKLFFNNVGKV